MASAQLQLVSNGQSWKLDRRTIEVGRAGLAKARAALAAASTTTDAELYGGLFAAEASAPVKSLASRSVAPAAPETDFLLERQAA
jgi:hypothetical protein